MTKKIFKFIVCVTAMMCLFCNSFVAFAENGDVDFDFNIQPIEPTTQEEVVETEKPTEATTKKPTEATTQKTTEATTEKTTKEPTRVYTTEAENEPVYNASENEDNNAQANDEAEQPTEEETTDETLPDGAFYVYLERNNGQRRLKTEMKKPGYVPEPQEPLREGYVFVGWYADKDFKKAWNFMTDKADKSITIYAKWEADDGTVVYNIKIADTVGGKIEVNPQKASMGEPVSITVTPDDGKRLVQGSLKINGDPTDFFSFVMPKGNVTITAEFEEIPEDEKIVNEKSKLPLFIILGVAVIVVLAVVIVLVKRRMDFNADLDPDEEEITTEDFEYESWIDESIVVEDGFKEGKIVVESTDPDYGAPEADTEE